MAPGFPPKNPILNGILRCFLPLLFADERLKFKR